MLIFHFIRHSVCSLPNLGKIPKKNNTRMGNFTKLAFTGEEFRTFRNKNKILRDDHTFFSSNFHIFFAKITEGKKGHDLRLSIKLEPTLMDSFRDRTFFNVVPFRTMNQMKRIFFHAKKNITILIILSHQSIQWKLTYLM